MVDVYSSTYLYIPVCTSMYFRYLNFTFFLEKDSILAYLLHWSCTLLQFTLKELPGCMRNLHVMFLVHTSTYQYYVLDKNSCTCMYQYSTYRYIQVRAILPDPVQVYRPGNPDDDPKQQYILYVFIYFYHDTQACRRYEDSRHKGGAHTIGLPLAQYFCCNSLCLFKLCVP